MTLDLYTQTLIGLFTLALVFGAIANKSNFCTMGAISDWVNFDDLSRIRAWFLAIATATLSVGFLEYFGHIDLSLTTDTASSNPPYRVANFIWLRHIFGGIMFGVGMTLASGCGNKTLVRLGEGNLKSIVVLVIIGASASLMLFTSFDHFVFLSWMGNFGLDLAIYDIHGQDIPSLLSAIPAIEAGKTTSLLTALIIGLGFLVSSLSSKDFRQNKQLVIAAFAIGGLVTAAWYLTAGPLGLELLEELDFADQRPYAAGAQSFSFIAPTAHLGQYAYQGFDSNFFSLGVSAILGIILGSFFYTLATTKIRIEWFADKTDFAMHALGASLMGIGGVLAMGCTIGQGITGVSTLALGSFITLASIILGCGATMKFQYFLMMREDD